MTATQRTLGPRTSLQQVQYVLFAIIVIVSVVSRPRFQLIRVFEQLRVPVEFQIVALSIPDFFVVLLIVISSFGLVVDSRYRQHFLQTMDIIILRFRGLLWVMFVVWLLLSVLWSGDTALPRFTTVHVIAMLFMATLMADYARKYGAADLLYPLVAGAVFQALVALLQVINNDPLGLYRFGEIRRFPYDPISYYRAPGLSSHSNYLGGYLMVALFALMILIALRLGTTSLTHHTNFVLYFIALVIVLGIIGTLSRSAVLSTAIGVIPIVLLVVRRDNPRYFMVALAVIGIVIIAWGLFVLAGPENIRMRIFSSREFFFDDSWAVIKSAPILGVGAGNLMLEVSQFSPVEPSTDILPVHNVYLFLWAEVGIIGLAIFITAVLIMLFSLLRRPPMSHLIWTCCLLAIGTVMLFDNYFWAVQPFRVLFFWAIGIWWGINSHPTEHEPTESVMPARSANSISTI